MRSPDPVGCVVWVLALGLVALALWGGAVCADSPVMVETPDQTATHPIGDFVHILRELEVGEWQHRRDGSVICWQAGPPETGAHPDSIYFYPRKPRWAALVTTGDPMSWATCIGLPWGWWVTSEGSPGYVALARELYQRYAVAFVYLSPSGLWDSTWEWHIRQEGP